MDLFEVATREKYRFPWNGEIDVEYLWDLGLESLDDIYKELNTDLKIEAEDSLLVKPEPEDKTLLNKIEIIKYIVKVKQYEAEEEERAIKKKQTEQKILEIMQTKQDEELKAKSIDELKAMLDEL